MGEANHDSKSISRLAGFPCGAGEAHGLYVLQCLSEKARHDGRSRKPARQDPHRQGRGLSIPSTAPGQSPWPCGGRHRHGQDRDAAGAGGGFLQRGHGGFLRRCEGRSVGSRHGGRGQGALRAAGERHWRDLYARPFPRRVLGCVRRAGPSRARHPLRNGAGAAGAPARSQRCAGGRAQHRLPHRRRTGPAAAGSEGSARAARHGLGQRRRTHQTLWQCGPRHRGRHPAAIAGAGKSGRRQVLRRARPLHRGFHPHRPRRARDHQCAGRRQADAQPQALRDLSAVDAVRTLRNPPRGGRRRQAQAGLLLR